MMMKSVLLFAAVTIGAAASTHAAIVQVTVTGEVESNQINSGVLGLANSGDAASFSFLVDSNVFVNGGFPTRGYDIDTSSFDLTIGGNSLGAQNPFPAEPAYFVLRDNDPAVDGFLLATDPDAFPNGFPLNQVGNFGNFRNNFSVTYDGGTLSSLDILDAVGTYDFTGLQVFGWTIDDGPFNAMLLLFEQMTIEVVPAPGTILLFAPLAFGRRRRRA